LELAIQHILLEMCEFDFRSRVCCIYVARYKRSY